MLFAVYQATASGPVTTNTATAASIVMPTTPSVISRPGSRKMFDSAISLISRHSPVECREDRLDRPLSIVEIAESLASYGGDQTIAGAAIIEIGTAPPCRLQCAAGAPSARAPRI